MNHDYICPVEATLEIVGGKYKPLILWHLSGKTLRFGQLQKLLSSATPKMLTKQLGTSFIPILSSICDWGNNYLKANNICPNCSMTKQK